MTAVQHVLRRHMAEPKDAVLRDIQVHIVRMLRWTYNEMAQTEVTAGEAEAVHRDLTRAQQGVAELAALVDALAEC